MKTKELIRQLLDADPTGEAEACVGNSDIHFVEKLPSYYDGDLQVLERDPNINGYNIIGGKYKRSGNKIKIHTLSFSDAITNSKEFIIDFIVDYSELSTENGEIIKKIHDEIRNVFVS